VKISSSAYLGVELLVRLAARNADPFIQGGTLKRTARARFSLCSAAVADASNARGARSPNRHRCSAALRRPPGDRLVFIPAHRRLSGGGKEIRTLGLPSEGLRFFRNFPVQFGNSPSESKTSSFGTGTAGPFPPWRLRTCNRPSVGRGDGACSAQRGLRPR
jgi:hypothetical protein